MIYFIDNYDSFTFNIVEILKKNNIPTEVHSRDDVDLADIQKNLDTITHFFFSPGPGHPNEAKACYEVLEKYHKQKPILGICLGHQVIADFFKAIVEPASQIMHGKLSKIFHSDTGIYKDIPQGFQATRYHSLIVNEATLPNELVKSSWTQDENNQCFEIMGIQHQSLPIHGLQFHPESILTPWGEKLILNFINQY